jgi:hypothetical protein
MNDEFPTEGKDELQAITETDGSAFPHRKNSMMLAMDSKVFLGLNCKSVDNL